MTARHCDVSPVDVAFDVVANATITRGPSGIIRVVIRWLLKSRIVTSGRK
jgi:hypothetical protein